MSAAVLEQSAHDKGGHMRIWMVLNNLDTNVLVTFAFPFLSAVHVSLDQPPPPVLSTDVKRLAQLLCRVLACVPHSDTVLCGVAGDVGLRREGFMSLPSSLTLLVCV
jgi:hypothetical protein